MDGRQATGFIGALLLIVGVFIPVASVPFSGSINLFQNGEGDGAIILVMGVVSLVLALAKQYKWLWVTGFASYAVIFFGIFAFQDHISQVEEFLAGNPFASAWLQSVEWQWGWVVLFAGAACMIACAAKKESPANPDQQKGEQ